MVGGRLLWSRSSPIAFDDTAWTGTERGCPYFLPRVELPFWFPLELEQPLLTARDFRSFNFASFLRTCTLGRYLCTFLVSVLSSFCPLVRRTIAPEASFQSGVLRAFGIANGRGGVESFLVPSPCCFPFYIFSFVSSREKKGAGKWKSVIRASDAVVNYSRPAASRLIVGSAAACSRYFCVCVVCVRGSRCCAVCRMVHASLGSGRQSGY